MTRLCVTVTDWLGVHHDEEAWATIDWRRNYDDWPRAVGGFAAYLIERGIAPDRFHVGTDEWIRDYAARFDRASSAEEA